jgi:ribosome-associated translation inhibitor RaiA
MDTLDISFRDMTPSASVEGAIRRWVGRLERMQARLGHCAVTVEQPHHHHRQGNLFELHVALDVPGRGAIAATAAHENAYTAVHDVFRAVRRQLQDQLQIRRGEIKQHA